MNKNIIEIDTREKKFGHVEQWFNENGIKNHRTTLWVGDYRIMQSPMTVIDRKAHLSELYGNICHEHDRFISECKRAQEYGVQLIFLIEDGKIGTLEGVKEWVNPRLKYTPYAWDGKRMYKAMNTIREKYGVEFLFCDKRRTGKRILEILETCAKQKSAQND